MSASKSALNFVEAYFNDTSYDWVFQTTDQMSIRYSPGVDDFESLFINEPPQFGLAVSGDWVLCVKS